MCLPGERRENCAGGILFLETILHFFLCPNRSTFAARPGGEIGRRTVFRSQHPQGCAGSNPVPGTRPCLSKTSGAFCLDAGRTCSPEQTNKKAQFAKRIRALGKTTIRIF